MMRRYMFTVGVLLAVSGSLAAAQDAGAEPIDVIHYQIEAEIVPENAYMRAQVEVTFNVVQDVLNLPFHLNSRLNLIGVFGGDERYQSRYDDFNSNRMLVKRTEPFSAGSRHTLRFEYDGTLETEQYAYLDTAERSPAFINREGALLLGQGDWFPSHDLPLDTATVRARVTVPLGFTVVGPGSMEPIETLGVTEAFTWKSERALGDVPIVVGRFLRERFEDGPVPLTFFVREDFDRDLEATVAEVKKILEFYRSQYGSLPVSGLSLAQVGNVELSGRGSLGLALLESAILDAPQLPIVKLARRLALQWWGYGIEIRSRSDAWLRDGFAAYAALRYIEVTYPDRYETERTLFAVDALKYQDKSPISDGLRLEMGTPQYKSIVSSKGAWVLYMLGQLVGKEKFDPLIGQWYARSSGKPTSTEQFRRFVEEQSGQEFGWFFLQWVESVGVPEFRLDYTILKRRDGNFRIKGQVKQNIDLFRMPVELTVETKGQPEEKVVQVGGRQTSFDFLTETLPLRIRIDPRVKILVDSEEMRLRVHIALGDEFRDQNEYVAAVTEYEKAKKVNPRSSLVHFRLGETYFKQVSYNLAANNFRDALNGDLEPEWVETWSHIHLGNIYDVLGQRQRALSEYQKAINTKVDYNGAQSAAGKYLKTPFTKPANVIQ